MKALEWKELGLRGLGELRLRGLRNWETKLLSLSFAFALWLWVNAGEREVQVVYFPLEFTGQPQETVLVGERLERVAVHLNGPRTLLAPVEANRRPIVLDLSGVKPDQATRLKIRDWMVRAPRGVRVMQIEPSKIPVALEQVRHVALPVKLQLKGEVSPGYRIDEASITVTPKKALVSGPGSALRSIKHVETEPVDVTGLKGPFKGKVALLAEHLAEVQPPVVSVEVGVVPVVESRAFEQVAVSARGLPADSYVLEPPTVHVTVKGPQEVMGGFELAPGSVFVAPRAFLEGVREARVRVKLPAGIELVAVQPPRVTIRPKAQGKEEKPPSPAGTGDREHEKKRSGK